MTEVGKKLTLEEIYTILGESASKQRTGIFILKQIRPHCIKNHVLKERWNFLLYCKKHWTREDFTNGAMDIWFKEVKTLYEDAMKYADMSDDMNK